MKTSLFGFALLAVAATSVVLALDSSVQNFDNNVETLDLDARGSAPKVKTFEVSDGTADRGQRSLAAHLAEVVVATGANIARFDIDGTKEKSATLATFVGAGKYDPVYPRVSHELVNGRYLVAIARGDAVLLYVSKQITVEDVTSSEFELTRLENPNHSDVDSGGTRTYNELTDTSLGHDLNNVYVTAHVNQVKTGGTTSNTYVETRTWVIPIAQLAPGPAQPTSIVSFTSSYPHLRATTTIDQDAPSHQGWHVSHHTDPSKINVHKIVGGKMTSYAISHGGTSSGPLTTLNLAQAGGAVVNAAPDTRLTQGRIAREILYTANTIRVTGGSAVQIYAIDVSGASPVMAWTRLWSASNTHYYDPSVTASSCGHVGLAFGGVARDGTGYYSIWAVHTDDAGVWGSESLVVSGDSYTSTSDGLDYGEACVSSFAQKPWFIGGAVVGGPGFAAHAVSSDAWACFDTASSLTPSLLGLGITTLITKWFW